MYAAGTEVQGPEVSWIDTATNTVVKTISLKDPDYSKMTFPRRVAFAPHAPARPSG